MKVFVNIRPALTEYCEVQGISIDEFRSSIASDEKMLKELMVRVFRDIDSRYENSISIPDTYLQGSQSAECNIDHALSLNILGLTQPEELIKEAEVWNHRLLDMLQKAMENLQKAVAKSHGYIPNVGTETYLLSKIAMTVNDDLHWSADYATALDEENSLYEDLMLKGTIPSEDLLRIKKSPEFYAVVQVWPK